MRSGQSASTPKVLYILGVYRSGTTLISKAIGEMEGFCCVGELRALWRDLGVVGSRCGCGEQLRRCEFWHEVLESTFGSLREALRESAHVKIWQDHLLGWSHTWLRVGTLLNKKAAGPAGPRYLDDYADVLGRLYQAIAAVSGSAVIVDSSKEAVDAAALRMVPQVHPYFMQVVRDPRGTVWSSLKLSRGSELSRAHPLHSSYAAVSWTALTLCGTRVRRVHDRTHSARSTMVLRYEDFTSDPASCLARIKALVGEASIRDSGAPRNSELAKKPLPSYLDESVDKASGRSAVTLSAHHSVAGNPNRFYTGRIEVTEDAAWRSHLHRIDRIAVTGLCAPLLARYGYPLGRGRASLN